MKKYVYIIYDPLNERIICVHNKTNVECRKCKKIRKENRDAYHLQEYKRIIFNAT